MAGSEANRISPHVVGCRTLQGARVVPGTRVGPSLGGEGMELSGGGIAFDLRVLCRRVELDEPRTKPCQIRRRQGPNGFCDGFDGTHRRNDSTCLRADVLFMQTQPIPAATASEHARQGI